MASSTSGSPSVMRKIEGSGGGERESGNLAGDSAGITEPGKTSPSFLVLPHPWCPDTSRSGFGESPRVCFRALTCHPTSKCRGWGYRPHVVVEPEGPRPGGLVNSGILSLFQPPSPRLPLLARPRQNGALVGRGLWVRPASRSTVVSMPEWEGLSSCSEMKATTSPQFHREFGGSRERGPGDPGCPTAAASAGWAGRVGRLLKS